VQVIEDRRELQQAEVPVAERASEIVVVGGTVRHGSGLSVSPIVRV
jgi:hypothetical protein